MPILGLKQGLPPVVLLGLLPVLLGLVAEEGLTLGSAASFCSIVRTKGYSTDLLDPTQVESKKCSQIQWPVPSINAEPVDIFLGEE